MPNYIVHLYHHARRHGESNTMPFPDLFLHQVRHSRNNLFDIQLRDTPALPKPNVLQSTCHIVLIPNIFQSTHCKYPILCRVCNTHLPYIHTSKFQFIAFLRTPPNSGGRSVNYSSSPFGRPSDNSRRALTQKHRILSGASRVPSETRARNVCEAEAGKSEPSFESAARF